MNILRNMQYARQQGEGGNYWDIFILKIFKPQLLFNCLDIIFTKKIEESKNSFIYIVHRAPIVSDPI